MISRDMEIIFHTEICQPVPVYSLVFIQKVIISSTDLDRNIVSSDLVLVCIRSDAKYLESLLEVQDYLVELLDLLD